ncbi:DsbC family protein [Sulfurivermis fontis]|uniref:DsbC family protein n=1 Tax=Sulfurivermis fontis TaxID=1972068 RepID=UPI000FDA0C57|nr:DsbC family protein [Sulfurivermis fontis]
MIGRRAPLAALLLVAASAVQAGEAEIRAALRSWMGDQGTVTAIREAGVLGLYEVQAGGEVFYMDPAGRYVFAGNILDLRAQRNLTQERKSELSRIDFAALPLALAAKQVKGKGRRVIATFEDPNCPYCRKLAQELEAMDDITVYTFLLPILSQDSVDKARAIWCAEDRSRAWRVWILDGKAPAAARCDAPMEELQALGRRYGITGTPTIFLSDGTRIGGYVPAAQLEQALAQTAQR